MVVNLNLNTKIQVKMWCSRSPFLSTSPDLKCSKFIVSSFVSPLNPCVNIFYCMLSSSVKFSKSSLAFLYETGLPASKRRLHSSLNIFSLLLLTFESAVSDNLCKSEVLSPFRACRGDAVRLSFPAYCWLNNARSNRKTQKWHQMELQKYKSRSTLQMT